MTPERTDLDRIREMADAQLRWGVPLRDVAPAALEGMRRVRAGRQSGKEDIMASITGTVKSGQWRGSAVEFGWAEETGLQATTVATGTTRFGAEAEDMAEACGLDAERLVARIMRAEARASAAARALGSKGGRANSPAQQAARKLPKPGAGRPKLPTIPDHLAQAMRVGIDAEQDLVHAGMDRREAQSLEHAWTAALLAVARGARLDAGAEPTTYGSAHYDEETTRTPWPDGDTGETVERALWQAAHDSVVRSKRGTWAPVLGDARDAGIEIGRRLGTR